MKIRWQGRAQLTGALPLGYALCWNTLQGTVIDVAPLFGQADPFGVQRWGGFYVSYWITACAITIDITNLMSDSDLITAIYPSNTAAPTHASTDTPPYVTVPYSKYVASSISTGGPAVKRIRHYHTMSKLLGRSKGAINNDLSYIGGLNLAGSPSSPASGNRAYWIITHTNSANSKASSIIGVFIKMTFYVTMFNRFDSSTL